MSNRTFLKSSNIAILSLGSNADGPFGTPRQALAMAVEELHRSGVFVAETSSVVYTKPYGLIRQPGFFNAIAKISTALPPLALLRLLKSIEARAGRKSSGPRWGPRTLDLDIVDYKGVVMNWSGSRPLHGQRLVLPHPGAHLRAFVLCPLAEIAPHWHHPVLGKTATQFLKDPRVRAAGEVLVKPS